MKNFGQRLIKAGVQMLKAAVSLRYKGKTIEAESEDRGSKKNRELEDLNGEFSTYEQLINKSKEIESEGKKMINEGKSLLNSLEDS